MKEIKILNQKIGDYFIRVDENLYKGRKGNALIIEKNKIIDLLKIKAFEEIPYLPNELLQKFLPPKYKNEIYLLDSKNLAIFDHSILSSQINDKNFYKTVLNFFNNDMAELIFAGSKQIETKDYYIFYLTNQKNNK